MEHYHSEKALEDINHTEYEKRKAIAFDMLKPELSNRPQPFSESNIEYVCKSHLNGEFVGSTISEAIDKWYHSYLGY